MDFWEYFYWFKAVVDSIDELYAHHQDIADRFFEVVEKAVYEKGAVPMLVFSVYDFQIGTGRQNLVERVWKAFEHDISGFTSKAASLSGLSQLSFFLEKSIDLEKNSFVDAVYSELKTHIGTLSKNSLSHNLDLVGVSLDRFRNHGHKELADRIYEEFENNVEQLAENALTQPLDAVGSFLNLARQNDHLNFIEKFWLAIVQNTSQLTSAIKEDEPKSACFFLITIPSELSWIGEDVAAEMEIADYTFDNYPKKGMAGACWFATILKQFGREDIGNTLINNILKRNNPADFNNPSADLLEISRLLYSVDSANRALPLVQNICTESWLNRCYKFSNFGLLAGTLSLLAMCQSPSIIHLFWCAGLRKKMAEAITNLKEKNGEELSILVQFIGASNLCGIRIPRLQITDLTLERIGHLPCKILPHEPDHVKVERWQRQLWIGLRTIATLSSMPIPVDLSALNKTYVLWKANEEETLAEPDQLPHRINQSMIKWLEDCLKHGGKELVASKEPLWCLAGFPKNIATFRSNI